MVDTGRDRIRSMLAAARTDGRAALLPYMTAGLPTVEASPGLFAAMAEAGADGFEIGIPYADPLMDGPVIMAAGERALAGGATVDACLEIVADVAAATAKPVLVMTYVNPVLHRGIDEFCAASAAAGASGLIVADLPVDEAEPFRAACDRHGLGFVVFAAPTTDDARLRLVAEADPVFVYAVAELGVTGERERSTTALGALAGRLRAVGDAPIVAGVGISTPEQAAVAAHVVDGVIVGSALVRLVLDAVGVESAADALRTAVSALRAAVENR